MSVSFEGKYVLIKSENFSEYLKSCGVNYLMRTIAAAATPTLDIFKDGNEWVFKTVLSFKTIELRFKLTGEEYEADFPDGSGRKIKGTATVEGNKVIQVQKTSDGDMIIDTREFTDDEMIVTLQHKDVTAIRIYQRKRKD